jgi:hypothetical protein
VNILSIHDLYSSVKYICHVCTWVLS